MHRDKEHKESLSLTALIIGSVSSAAAAVVVHEIWHPGAILGAGVTPVLIALFAEALRRPIERVTVRTRRAPVPGETIRIYRSRPRWTIALLTGLTAFVLGTAGLTASELLLQRSVGDRGAATTLFDTRPQSRSTTPVEAEPHARPVRPASEVEPDRSHPPRVRARRRDGSSKRSQERPQTPTATPTPAPSPAEPPPTAQPTPSPTPPATREGAPSGIDRGEAAGL